MLSVLNTLTLMETNVYIYTHINACSLSKLFDNLEHLVKYNNKSFDIIAVSEPEITKSMSKLCDINLKNYSIKSTPTESTASGTSHYIAHNLSNTPRKDLNICKKRNLNQLSL